MIKSDISTCSRRQLAKLAFGAPLAASFSGCVSHTAPSKKTLEVTLEGPFALGFPKDTTTNKIIVYAPICDGHEAYVETDQDRIQLNRDATVMQGDCPTPIVSGAKYELHKPGPDPNQTYCYNLDSMIHVNWNRCQYAPPSDKCYFQLELPRPDFILGLAPAVVSYTENDLNPAPETTCAQRATATRLFYTGLDSAKNVMLLRTNPKPTTIFDASHYPDLPSVQRNIPIRFRYAPANPRCQEGQDASVGAIGMLALFPPLDKWSMNFSTCSAAHAEVYMFHHSGDCGSVQLTLVSTSQIQQWQSQRAG